MANFPGHMFAPAGCIALDAPHMSDPAFEPHANFDFEDGAHHFADLDHTMTSLDTYEDGVPSQPAYRETGKIQTNGLGNSSGNQFGPESISADNLWAVEQGALGMAPHSGQADIATKRSESVNHHFGQLTPPQDGGLPTAMLEPLQRSSSHPFSNASTPAQAMPNSKSERARNAANQRHAKAKKVKQEFQAGASSPQSDEIGSSDDRREKYREKNRLAAAKCRAKKKTNVEDLEDRARHATARNSQLKLQARELRDAFSELRSHALMHDPSQGCRCSQIHLYNANKAQEAARGAITMPVFLSASMQGHDAFGAMETSSFDEPDHAARTASVSLPNHVREMRLHHPRSQSFVDSSPFLSGHSAVDMLQQDRGAIPHLGFDEE